MVRPRRRRWTSISCRFLRGQSSKIITKLFEEDKAAFVLKSGRPLAVLMSIERYERLMKAGIDITEY